MESNSPSSLLLFPKRAPSSLLWSYCRTIRECVLFPMPFRLRCVFVCVCVSCRWLLGFTRAPTKNSKKKYKEVLFETWQLLLLLIWEHSLVFKGRGRERAGHTVFARVIESSTSSTNQVMTPTTSSPHFFIMVNSLFFPKGCFFFKHFDLCRGCQSKPEGVTLKTLLPAYMQAWSECVIRVWVCYSYACEHTCFLNTWKQTWIHFPQNIHCHFERCSGKRRKRKTLRVRDWARMLRARGNEGSR